MEFKEITSDQFALFSKNYAHTNFWQSTNMAGLREWNGWKSAYVAAYDGESIVAATMLSYRVVFMKSTFVQAVRGFLIDFHNLEVFDFFHHNVMEYLKKLNCMYFKIDPYLLHIERDSDGNVVENGMNNEDIVEHMKSLGYQHMGYLRGNDIAREPNWMFVLNLCGKSEEELLKSFDQQTRWSINKTVKMGVEIREVSNENLASFKDIMDHTAKRRGFEDHDMHYYEGLFQNFYPQGNMKALEAVLDLTTYTERLQAEREKANQELIETTQALQAVSNSKKFNKKKKVLLEDIALLDKKLSEVASLQVYAKDGVLTLAAATFILYGKEVMYLYSGAYDEFMKFNGPYAIQWYIIRYAIAHGYERYNFYGISGIFEKDAEDYGIYEFKKGFTGVVEELVGDFYFDLQPKKRKAYEAARNVKHLIKR